MPNKDLYFLKYNNYFNRKVRRELTLNDYLEKDTTYLDAGDIINWSPGDGVATTQIVSTDFYDATKDYCVVCASGTTTIESRWFVIESQYLKTKQYRLTLRRDVIADNLNDTANAIAFIEKGPMAYNDSAIFNNENITVNQIKKAQQLIYDDTGIPWIVATMAKNRGLGINYAPPSGASISADYTVENVSDLPFYNWIGTPSLSYDYRTNFYVSCRVKERETVTRMLFRNVGFGGYTDPLAQDTAFDVGNDTGTQVQSKITNLDNNNLSSVLALAAREFIDKDKDGNNYYPLREKVVFEKSTGTFYRIKYTENFYREPNGVPLIYSQSPTAREMYKMMKAAGYSADNENLIINSQGDGLSVFWLFALVKEQNITLEVEANPQTAYRYYVADLHPAVANEPFDAIALPFGSLDCEVWQPEVGSKRFTTDVDATLAVLCDLSAKPQGLIYDISILPWCPVSHTIATDGHIVFHTAVAISIGTTNKSFLAYVQTSRTDRTVTLPAQRQIAIETDPVERKVLNEGQMLRLCSPGYESTFDFNPQKNDGFVAVRCYQNVKPYTPSCVMKPVYNSGSLYGGEYTDPRGILFGSNTSLSRSIDRWQEYELNNKNYQRIFDRQMQSLDFRNDIQERRDIVGAVSSAIATGAAAGLATGNVAVGAAAGIASGIGGALDVSENKALRQEQRDLTRDLFGYQLGNIKALPNTLARVDALTSQNTIVPYIEYYDCTPEEKEAIRKKIEYNGMTVMRCGKISDYIAKRTTGNKFIKAKLIYLNLTSGDDAHMYDAIYEELNNGLYWEV